MTQQRLQFPPRTAFFETLKSRVDGYLQAEGKRPTGNWRLAAKALLALGAMFGGYVWLVFLTDSLWQAVLAAFVMVQGMVLTAFGVMHDGAHGSLSRRRWLNWLAGATMDVLGSSSMLWRQKHNMLHHTYTNVDGKDDDIAIGSLMRFSPSQPRKPWHRLQHWYAPLLYSLLSLYLLFFSDFQKVFTGRIGETALQPRKWWELPYFFSVKLAYFAYALLVPMLLHPWWLVLSFFIGMHLLFGLTLSLVFQLAHTVEGADFPLPDANGLMPYDWAEHQLRTTANFAPGSRLVNFYTGGLNHQVEHHLFHKMSHVHYPAISRIVRDTCREFGIVYHSFGTTRAAILAHFRHLRRMGQPV
ncbi:fatty acid desaturase family protein [Parachitinimonas caeni]|uniref:Acyl-CoA desaturase n=1 Tax=Parachitinimonas caeni TaxID=3031301 RepID=A0ABT7E0E2_9NEIS|nr:acyl-CoA desaturase [Parachitinimonas caeni]MDK2124900.1 acyl-CoA desaturase [Parachitinimonas caeni]